MSNDNDARRLGLIHKLSQPKQSRTHRVEATREEVDACLDGDDRPICAWYSATLDRIARNIEEDLAYYGDTFIVTFEGTESPQFVNSWSFKAGYVGLHQMPQEEIQQ